MKHWATVSVGYRSLRETEQGEPPTIALAFVWSHFPDVKKSR